MKFNIKWALAVVVVVLVGLAAAPWTVSQDAQIAAIETQIKAGSGLRLVSHGRSVFAVLPRPHIRIYDARLEQGSGALTLSTSSLRVDLGLAGLATGQLSLARAVLADAVFTLDAVQPAGGDSIGRIAPLLGEPRASLFDFSQCELPGESGSPELATDTFHILPLRLYGSRETASCRAK